MISYSFCSLFVSKYSQCITKQATANNNNNRMCALTVVKHIYAFEISRLVIVKAKAETINE